MTVFVVLRYFYAGADECSIGGVFKFKELAEKYIKKCKLENRKFIDRMDWYIEEEEVVGE